MILVSIFGRGGRRLAAGVLLLGLLTGCGRSAGAPAGSSRVSVVASFYPLFEAAQRVGGDRVHVTNLTPSGAEPHDLELSPTQVDGLLDARMVLYMGSGFQPAVEDVAKERTEGATVDVLAGLSQHLLELDPSERDQDAVDPHVWLDPVLMRAIVDEVEGALSREDTSGGAAYRRRAADYRSDIERLARQFEDGLRDCSRRVLVTSHAAFGYLAARYGLRQEPIAGLSPEAEPDPKRLADLADLVRREGVTTIFTEELVSPRVAETLAREAGVRTAVLNPLEGLTAAEQARGETYVSVMQRNLRTLRSALGCP